MRIFRYLLQSPLERGKVYCGMVNVYFWGLKGKLSFNICVGKRGNLNRI